MSVATAKLRVYLTGTGRRLPAVLLVLSLSGPALCFAQAGEANTQPAGEALAPLEGATIMPSPFPIRVLGDLGGLKIAVEAGYTGADAYARLSNEDQVQATCKLHFRAGSDNRRRRQRLDVGQQALVVAGLRRHIVSLQLQVICETSMQAD